MHPKHNHLLSLLVGSWSGRLARNGQTRLQLASSARAVFFRQDLAKSRRRASSDASSISLGKRLQKRQLCTDFSRTSSGKTVSAGADAAQAQAPAPAAAWLLVRQVCQQQPDPTAAHPQQGPRSSDQDLAEARCTLQVKLRAHSDAKAKADASCSNKTSAADAAVKRTQETVVSAAS